MSEDNVVRLKCVTRLDLDPDVLLKESLGQLSEVVIVGFTTDGEEFFAASKADGGAALWHLARAQKKLLALADED